MGETEKFDLRKWFKEARQNPREAIIAVLFAVVLAIILGVSAGIGGWFGDRTKDVLTAACARIHVCASPEEKQEQPGTLVFSTHVPNCLTGRVAYKFRDWTPPPIWENGADRLIVCADASAPVTRADMPEKLEKLVPECLSVRRDGDNTIISTKIRNPAVCRARYRFEGTKLVESTLEQGWFVCTPGHDHDLGVASFTMAGAKISACEEEILRRYGFGSSP